MDRETLSPKAREIFGKLKSYFPPDPWKNPHWKEEGLVHDNRWFDLRKKADRELLEEQKKSFIGYTVMLAASRYRKRNRGSLSGFDRERYSRMTQHEAEILLLLQDLSFKIETMDIVDSP